MMLWTSEPLTFDLFRLNAECRKPKFPRLNDSDATRHNLVSRLQIDQWEYRHWTHGRSRDGFAAMEGVGEDLEVLVAAEGHEQPARTAIEKNERVIEKNEGVIEKNERVNKKDERVIIKNERVIEKNERVIKKNERVKKKDERVINH